jgi:hypothetical protein
MFCVNCISTKSFGDSDGTGLVLRALPEVILKGDIRIGEVAHGGDAQSAGIGQA